MQRHEIQGFLISSTLTLTSTGLAATSKRVTKKSRENYRADHRDFQGWICVMPKPMSWLFGVECRYNPRTENLSNSTISDCFHAPDPDFIPELQPAVLWSKRPFTAAGPDRLLGERRLGRTLTLCTQVYSWNPSSTETTRYLPKICPWRQSLRSMAPLALFIPEQR